MKEYEKHIRSGYKDDPEYLCGEKVDDYEWSFVDLTHAFLNMRGGGRLLPCPDCAKVAVECFKGEGK